MIRIKPTDIVVGLALGLCFVGNLAMAREDNWGAISLDTATSGKSPDYGIGGGDTKDEAVEAAQKVCREGGTTACISVATYKDCGAVATDSTTGGWGIGATKAAAEIGAMEACKGDNCKIVATDCN